MPAPRVAFFAFGFWCASAVYYGRVLWGTTSLILPKPSSLVGNHHEQSQYETYFHALLSSSANGTGGLASSSWMSQAVAAAAVTASDAKEEGDKDGFTTTVIPSYREEHPCTLDTCQLMETYLQQHSHDALLAEWQACQNESPMTTASSSPACRALRERQFVVADYSCPHEAGNLLYITMNKVLYGILTNRTVLVRYMTTDVCHEICHDGGNDKMCPRCAQTNTQADCNVMLQLSPAWPSYDTWYHRLQLPPSVAVNPDNATLHVRNLRHNDDDQYYRVVRLWNKISGIHTSRGYAKYQAKLPKVPPRQKGQQKSSAQDLLTPDEWYTRHLHEQLGRRGVYFLYGMLFHTLWDLTPAVQPPARTVIANPHTTRTIVLHSRHVFANDHSSKVQQACLRDWVNATSPRALLPHYRNESSSSSCTVYLMADRQETLETLTNVTRSLHCTPVRVEQHVPTDTVISAEHGPFAGMGFFQDLALAAAGGRHAFSTNGKNANGIGWQAMRTSSQLIWAVMNYRAAVEGFGRPKACGFLNK